MGGLGIAASQALSSAGVPSTLRQVTLRVVCKEPHAQAGAALEVVTSGDWTGTHGAQGPTLQATTEDGHRSRLQARVVAGGICHGIARYVCVVGE